MFPQRSLTVLFCTAGLTARGLAQAPGTDRVALRLDTAEAVAVLAILERQASGQPVGDSAWRALFAAEGYVRLKAREAGLHRDFSDSDFVAFVRTDSLIHRAGELRRTLSAWERMNVNAAAARALAYLPPAARIRATVYVVIKPRTNSFVFEVRTNPAIFLYLDPARTGAQFENTVAHELHHIGFASVQGRTDSILAALPDSARKAAEWMGAFGEGFAMLAAAGGPDVHPHAVSPPQERARWDRDVSHFNADLRSLERFFLDVMSKRLAGEDTVNAIGFSFFGEQGPWYTVGWRMALTIERRYGRAVLIQCMEDPRLLLDRYNEAAAGHNRTHADTLARWSPTLLSAIARQ
ncbi:MAG TPA: DUF5700 domain-containing putative Zn-dependent protease [Gemmatimonadales bacterium]|nr:DUF5700 domain-containing putative Zn-dependent protease [Gemmatimonadales bacterium]